VARQFLPCDLTWFGFVLVLAAAAISACHPGGAEAKRLLQACEGGDAALLMFFSERSC
jgi:hypothetical protein